MADYEDQTLRLWDFAVAQGAVRGKSFLRCQIIGPAVVQVEGHTTFDRCTFAYQESIDEILWEVPDGAVRVGVFVVDTCTFDECHFAGVGWAGARGFINDFKANVGH